METVSEKTFFFGDFELNAAKRTLLKSGEAVSLNSKTFDLLLVLVENRGKVLGKNELLNRVWEGQFVEENNLTVQISALRKIFGEKKGAHQFIATIPGKGYKFVGELNDKAGGEIVIENHKIERLIVDEEIESAPETVKQLPPKRRNSTIVFALVGLLLIAGIGVWFFINRSTANHEPIESIAVMPFVYEGANGDAEYLSDGMTESLINNLSQLPNLTVKARNSVFHYKGKPFDANKIGGELTVQAVLLGRIVERGDNFNVSLELVDARTNNHLWGGQYARQASDLATLQTEIARDVSAKLRQKLTGGEALPRGQTANAEAYQLYLKGRFLWNKRRHEEHLKAIAAFEQAIALDPNFALAYAGIGDAYTVNSFEGDSAERNPKARAAALKALAIAPDSAEALTVLAKVEWNEFDRAAGEKNFRRAIELNPNYASARQWYAEFLNQQGRSEEAVAEIRRALELDPLSPVINSDAVFIYALARQFDRAIAHADKALELDANWRDIYQLRGIAHDYKRNYSAAVADYEKANELSNLPTDRKERVRAEIKEVKAELEKSGAKNYWQKYLEIEKRQSEVRDYFLLAIIYANLGDKENALYALEKSLEKKEDAINYAKVEPYFDFLKSEPRYQAVLARIGL